MTQNDENIEQTDESTEEVEDTTTEEEADDSSSQDIDYDAIAEAEEKRKPDPVLARLAHQERQAKKELTDDDSDDEDDKPMTRREAREFFSGFQSEFTKTTSETRATQYAGSIASSDAEARAITATWRNRQFPTGMSIEDQIEEAQAIVNRKKNAARTRELGRALQNKPQKRTAEASTHRDAPAASAPKLSPADADALKRAGFVYDGVRREWKKPLQGGKKHLYKKTLASKPYIE